MWKQGSWKPGRGCNQPSWVYWCTGRSWTLIAYFRFFLNHKVFSHFCCCSAFKLCSWKSLLVTWHSTILTRLDIDGKRKVDWCCATVLHNICYNQGLKENINSFNINMKWVRVSLRLATLLVVIYILKSWSLAWSHKEVEGGFHPRLHFSSFPDPPLYFSCPCIKFLRACITFSRLNIFNWWTSLCIIFPAVEKSMYLKNSRQVQCKWFWQD